MASEGNNNQTLHLAFVFCTICQSVHSQNRYREEHFQITLPSVLELVIYPSKWATACISGCLIIESGFRFTVKPDSEIKLPFSSKQQ